IVNMLHDDFKWLVKEQVTFSGAYESEGNRIYKTHAEKRFNYYFLGNESEQLEKIVNTTKTNEKVEINFTSSDGKIAEKIEIKHNNIKLKIDLEKFKNN